MADLILHIFFWDKFNARKPELEKCLEYFKIESIDNPCKVMIAVNPREYLQAFRELF